MKIVTHKYMAFTDKPGEYFSSFSCHSDFLITSRFDLNNIIQAMYAKHRLLSTFFFIIYSISHINKVKYLINVGNRLSFFSCTFLEWLKHCYGHNVYAKRQKPREEYVAH